MNRRSKGSALALVLILATVSMILGTTVLYLSVSHNKIIINQEKNMKAYYGARSGADAVASYIIKNPSKVSNLITQISSVPGTGTIGENQFEVSVKNISGLDEILIESKAYEMVDGVKQYRSQVSLSLVNVISSISEFTVFSDDAPDLGNNTVINGDVVTNATVWTSYDPSRVNGNVTLGANLTFQPVDPALFTSPYDEAYRMRDGDALYQYLVGDFSDSTVDDLDWDPAYHSPGGTCQLHLFVSDSNSINLRYIHPPDGILIFVYYNGTGYVTADNGNFDIHHVNIYAPRANFRKNGGGNGTFEGRMIVAGCTFPNSHGQINFDPGLDQEDILGSQVYKRDIWGY